MWKYIKSSAIEEPPTFDASNPSVVYVRKNIERITEQSPSGRPVKLWGYMEQIIPKKDWEVYQSLLEVDGNLDTANSTIEDLTVTMADTLMDVTLLQLGM